MSAPSSPAAARTATPRRARTRTTPTFRRASTRMRTTRTIDPSASARTRARRPRPPSTEERTTMALCKVMIIGNLGSDPEMRYTPSNRAVTQFNVAVNQSTKNQQTGEWVEETDWFRVSVWGDRAERMAETLRKGNKVFVEGRFKTRTFEGRDGQTRTALEITADSIVNLERRPRDEEGSFGGPSGDRQPAGSFADGGGGPAGGDNVRPTRAPTDDTDLDDLPF